MAKFTVAPHTMVMLGYGKYVKADMIQAIIPLEGDDRMAGSRTRVLIGHPAGEIVASRSETSIVRDMGIEDAESIVPVEMSQYIQLADDIYSLIKEIPQSVELMLQETANIDLSAIADRIAELRGYQIADVDEGELA